MELWPLETIGVSPGLFQFDRRAFLGSDDAVDSNVLRFSIIAPLGQQLVPDSCRVRLEGVFNAQVSRAQWTEAKGGKD